MDTTSLFYFRELARELHMTRTAERLFISQQTLSNHIQRLEQQLGCQLFLRKPSLSLTYAGEQVLRFADDLLRSQENLENILAEITEQDRGLIRFGASALRMNACLPAILPEFSAEFPEVELRLLDYVSNDLEPRVLSEELDFAVTAEGTEESALINEFLMDDPIFLCVSERLLRQVCGDRTDALKARAINGADIRDFSGLPYCSFENRLGYQVRQCFQAAGLTPKVRFTAYHTQIVTTIGLKGLAAFFGTQMGLSNREDEILDDMNIFPLVFNGKPLCQRIQFIRNPKRYMTRYDLRFRELIFRYFTDLKAHRIQRTARF